MPTPAATFASALALHQQGDLAGAAALYTKVIRREPRHAGALHSLGLIALQRGDAATAERRIGEALRIDPGQAQWRSNRGLALLQLGRTRDALLELDQAVRLRADTVDAHTNRSMALYLLGRFDEALEAVDRALFLNARSPQAHNNRALILGELDRGTEALASCDKALALAPGYTDALANRAVLLLALHRLPEAIECSAAVLAALPDSAEAHWAAGIVRLTAGDLPGGLPEYEWRWRKADFRTPVRDLKVPLWRGDEPLAGKTILIHPEQGLGDTVQLARYAPLLAARGARVVLEVQPVLRELLASVPGVTRVIAWGDPLPSLDYHCPLMTLPLAFGTTLATIPATVPYVSADPGRVARWQERLGPRTRPRVGLVWAGSAFHRNDRRRSLALATLLPLLEAGVEVISLQRDLREADTAVLKAEPRLRHVGDELEGFADTAGVLACLDLLVTVDTAPAHVAGALGLPFWLLLPHTPDWRWLLARSDSPWYPTARLFRQPAPGNWAPVVAEVAAALQQLAAS